MVQSGETAKIISLRRKLKADGPMDQLQKSGRKFLEEYKFKKFLVCLFNDLIVVARLPPAKGFSTGRSKQKDDLNKVKKIEDLNNCSIKSSSDSKLKFIFTLFFLTFCVLELIELKAGEETFKLVPLNPNMKNNFVSEFQRAVEELNRAKVFGVPLIDTVKRENPKDGIPLIIRRSVSVIEENLTVPGIFRLAGAKTEITNLRQTFDKGKLFILFRKPK